MELKLSKPTNENPPKIFDEQEFQDNFKYFDTHTAFDPPEVINQMFVGLLYNVYFMLCFKRIVFYSDWHRWRCAQFIIEEIFVAWKNDWYKGTPILSSARYCWRTLVGIRGEWLRWENGWHSWQKVAEGDYNFIPNDITPLAELLADETDNFSDLEFSHSISQIYLTAKNIVNTVPAKNKTERHNIYISCLLTLFYKITYANTKGFNPRTVILFRLDDNYKPRIMVLVKQIQKALVRDLCYQSQTKIHTADLSKLLTSLELKGRDDY